MTFDLGHPVGDVAWVPSSATTFAAVTEGGRVHVYDLAASRHRPACVQKVAHKAKLTKLAFNPRHPVVLVGDERWGPGGFFEGGRGPCSC